MRASNVNIKNTRTAFLITAKVCAVAALLFVLAACYSVYTPEELAQVRAYDQTVAARVGAHQKAQKARYEARVQAQAQGQKIAQQEGGQKIAQRIQKDVEKLRVGMDYNEVATIFNYAGMFWDTRPGDDETTSILCSLNRNIQFAFGAGKLISWGRVFQNSPIGIRPHNTE